MHCAIQRTCSNFPKDADRQNSFLSTESLEKNNFSASSKDCEVSSVVWRNSSHRSAILTLFAPEPNGQWRIVALPLQCSDDTIQLGSGSQVDLDGHHLVSPSLVGSLKADRQKAQRWPTTDRSYSVRSHTARSFSGSNFQCQSRNKGLANKEDKAVKKSSRKKGRKKGKLNKKISGDTDLTELECAHGSSIAETVANKDMDNGVGLLAYATAMAVSQPEHSCDGNYSERNGINCYATPKTCTSCVDEGDVSEALVPSVLQNFSSERHLSHSENLLQTKYPGVSILNGEVQDPHCELVSCSDDPYSNIFSEAYDSLVLDSVSIGSNSDKSFNADYDIKLSNEESGGIDVSKLPGYDARKRCPSAGNMLNGVVGSYSHEEITNCCRHGCTSGDRHRKVPAKREKQIRRVPRNSSIYRKSSVGNLSGRSGKENNHCVWQKVQRNDADKCNYKSRKVNSVCSQFDIGLEENPLHKMHRKIVDSNVLSNSEDKNQAKLKVSGKLKRKTSSESKQEYNYASRKGYHASIQQNGLSKTPAQMSRQKELDSVSGSHPKASCQRIGFQSKRVESITFQPVRNSQICPSELGPLESVYTTVPSLNDPNAENQISSLSRSCNSLAPSELHEELSAIHLHRLLGDEGAKVVKVSPADHSKQDTSSGVVLQKWLPVGIKDSGLPGLGQPSALSMAKLDEPAGENLQNIAQEELASDSHAHVSTMSATIMCSGRSSKIVNGSPSEDKFQVQKLSKSTCTPNKYNDNDAATKCLIHEPDDPNICASENDSSEVVCAVNDSLRAQLASNAVQMATGYPIAEFEKLLHSASPVICPSGNISGCRTFSCDQVVGASLCRHETPNISLGSLWQWYEKHGSYGLEVRAEDYEHSTRFGIDRFAFRAYFVPFLSAVQLFRKRKGHPADNSNVIPSTKAMEPSELYKTSENKFNIDRLPIFSLLVPQPRREDSSVLAPVNHMCYSELSSVCNDANASFQPVDSRWPDNLELLFEYFESEQPQKRRPLFEMIKELVTGDGPTQSRAYGDPTILESVGLHDLHPKSWYSVAWYPIYRIPDGNFRAAFLTYHSLGHLVCRGPTNDSLSIDACIVSPVVGLQSYNAQGECWFQPRHPAHTQIADVSNSNPAGILKERLETLEQTASLMARAVVTKGGQTYVNRQPDYEFFLSRRR